MNQHGSCLVLQSPDPSFCNSILKMSIYSTESDCLACFLDSCHELVLCKPAIVTMKALDLDLELGRKPLEGQLCFKSFICIGWLLKVDVGQTTEEINKDWCHLVPFLGEPTLDLGNEPWSAVRKLINADALPWLWGCSKISILLNNLWLGFPWPSDGFPYKQLVQVGIWHLLANIFRSKPRLAMLCILAADMWFNLWFQQRNSTAGFWWKAVSSLSSMMTGKSVRSVASRSNEAGSNSSLVVEPLVEELAHQSLHFHHQGWDGWPLWWLDHPHPFPLHTCCRRWKKLCKLEQCTFLIPSQCSSCMLVSDFPSPFITAVIWWSW